MILTVELKPEAEASLLAQATARGLDLSRFVEQLLEDHVRRLAAPLSPHERAEAWRKPSALPARPLLSDEAIERASFYDTRG